MMWIRLNDEELGLIKAALAPLTIQAAKDLVEKIEEKQAPRSYEDLLYIGAADEFHHVDGELEFDSDTIVSAGEDPGAYVMGWCWVSDVEAGIPGAGE